MSFQVNNFIGKTGNDDITVIDSKGPFRVAEYKRDLSVSPFDAQIAYFSSEMGVRKRQLVCRLNDTGITTQAGAMQWFVGDINCTTGIKGARDFVGKAFRGKVTGESAIKPEYKGKGLLVLEPTYRYLVLLDASEWPGGIVLDDGLFLACESTLDQSAVMRSNLSSALAGGEGLFNLKLSGDGVVCIEADCPYEELIEVNMKNDELKIDGNFAVAWSAGLKFTVERSGKSLLGSAASGEGLVNVYRGTGRVLMMPVRGSRLSIPHIE